MTASNMNGSDLRLRHIDKDGKAHEQTHRVWDADTFLRTQQEAARKEGGRVEVVIREKTSA